MKITWTGLGDGGGGGCGYGVQREIGKYWDLCEEYEDGMERSVTLLTLDRSLSLNCK